MCEGTSQGVEKENGERRSFEFKKGRDGLQVTDEQCHQASNIILSARSDHALRGVLSVIGNKMLKMAKLNELNDRYDFKTIGRRISKMSQLFSLKYASLSDSIYKQIDKLDEIIEKLCTIGTVLDMSTVTQIIVALIDVQELNPVTAAIRTLEDQDVSLEDVSARLIDETTNLKKWVLKSIKRSNKVLCNMVKSIPKNLQVIF